MSPDRPTLGIALMIGFTVTAPLMDAFAKLASPSIPIGQIVAVRFVLQGLILLPVAIALRQVERPSRNDAGLHLLRAALILLATSAFFAALRVMPIADAVAIFFVEPFILTLLGALLLNESIGWRRLVACGVGFAGALLVIRPSFSAFGMVATLPLLTALFFAFYLVLTRRIARRIPPVALQFWTALAASALILPALALAWGADIPPMQVVLPEGRVWFWLAGVGIVASVSHLMISFALRFAPAATLAPMHYLEIVSATALGFAIFGDLPDLQTFFGIALIVGSGIVVVLRERRLEQAAPPAPPPPI